jgi:tricorn protease
MHAHGFAEFQRGYLTEHDALGLIIDVRWNSGGHISSLLLEKLACLRIGYRFWRWKQPRSYPFDSPRGPMVALANEYTASDGDKFAHSFKLMGLGPLIGTRTWGGVIGISSYRYLVDGTAISQPECANWFPDVSWHLENHGTEPDILVEHTPHDEASGADAQLQRAIEACLTLIEHSPSEEPTL